MCSLTALPNGQATGGLLNAQDAEAWYILSRWRNHNPEPESDQRDALREFKKYPNRRLYDLEDSHYVTIEDVRKLILKGDSIRVLDSKDGTDITRQILLQILSEQEAAGHEPVLTNRVIEQMIRFYGDNVGSVVSRYIEQSILTFLEHQDQLRKRMREMSDLNPFNFMRQAMERTFTDPRKPRADTPQNKDD
jgi:polyhydroxyalkanoate synthesis repressor PhaR